MKYVPANQPPPPEGQWRQIVCPTCAGVGVGLTFVPTIWGKNISLIKQVCPCCDGHRCVWEPEEEQIAKEKDSVAN